MKFILKRGLLITLILFFLFNALILQSENVHALKLYPGKVETNFEPNKVIESEVCFIPEGRNHLKIESEGSLAEYVTLERDEIYVTEDDYCVLYNITLPASFDRPGIHDHYISGTEIPKGAGQGNSFVIKVKINQKIVVHVPYPGKYLEISQFTAQNAEAGEPISFQAKIISKGKETINNVKGVIRIYDKDEQLLETLNTNSLSTLTENQKETLYAVWDSGEYEKGNYHALLQVTYDGEENEKTAEFKLGGLDIQLLDYTKKTVLGGIREFYISIESIWSETIPNTRAGVVVFDDQGNELTSFETISKNLVAWEKTNLKGYLDTSNLKIGTFNTKITLYFSDLTKEYDGIIEIIEEPKPEEEKEKSSSSKTVVRIILGLAALLLIVLFFFLIRLLIPKKGKKKVE